MASCYTKNACYTKQFVVMTTPYHIKVTAVNIPSFSLTCVVLLTQIIVVCHNMVHLHIHVVNNHIFMFGALHTYTCT